MRRILRAVLVLAVAAMSFIALDGCAANKTSRAKTENDAIIQHYVQKRSDLLAQRRRLAATYGPTSPQVADIDRQIALADQAADQRRSQLIEEEHARQAVAQMKREAAPAAESPATLPATQPGQ